MKRLLRWARAAAAGIVAIGMIRILVWPPRQNAELISRLMAAQGAALRHEVALRRWMLTSDPAGPAPMYCGSLERHGPHDLADGRARCGGTMDVG